MTNSGPAHSRLAPLIRKALATRDTLRLGPQQIGTLSSLYCSVCVAQSFADQALTRRERDMAHAIGRGTIDPVAIQALVEDAQTLRAELETRTANGFEALRSALTGEQLSELLASEEGLASVVPGSTAVKQDVDAYLDEKIKGKDVVEVEIAGKVADRLISWAKIFGVFVAAPVTAVMIFLSVFGITKVSDIYAYVSDYEKKLQQTLDNAKENAQAIEKQVVDLRNQTETLRNQNETLSSDVKKLKECVYGNSARTEEATRSALENALAGFAKHMVDVGFKPNAKPVSVVIGPDDMLPGAFAYYESDKRRIVLSPCAAGETGMVFREYGHEVMPRTLRFDMDAANDMGLNAIETGLVSYFACSYQNDPTLGRPRPQSTPPGANTEPIVNLENKRTLADAASLTASDFQKMYGLGDAWGGLFWDIRKAVGRELADPIILAAWHALPPPGVGTRHYSAEMATRLLAEVRAKAGEQKAREVRALLDQRSLNF